MNEQGLDNTLRVERAIFKISQQQLADDIGVSRQTINAIELGKFVPSTILAIKIARRFGQRVEDVFILP